MAPKQSKAVAEIKLLKLKNCLVNLPQYLSEVLINANVAAQNVVVELEKPDASELVSPSNAEGLCKSVYVGWTGMSSQWRESDREKGPFSTNYNSSNRNQGLVEIDATLGRLLGLSDHLKVVVSLHVEPPIAHTVNIEPLTITDWEIIELHATFLETNLQAQVRALPNPGYTNTSFSLNTRSHPITLHLSPTSTANIVVTSIAPPISSDIGFVKLSSDAEVIVAPKTRPQLTRSHQTDASSITSTSRKSTSTRAGPSYMRQKCGKGRAMRPLFLRGSDQSILSGVPSPPTSAQGVELFVGRNILALEAIRATTHVCVSIVNPDIVHGPNLPPYKQKSEEQEVAASGPNSLKIVAKLSLWHDAPDSRHALLSSSLASALEVAFVAGSILRIESAPPPLPKNSPLKIDVFPFLPPAPIRREGSNFRGETNESQHAAAQTVRSIYSSERGGGVLDGPLTDGLVLPPVANSAPGWYGGILHLDHAKDVPRAKKAVSWINGQGLSFDIRLQHDVANTFKIRRDEPTAWGLVPIQAPSLVANDQVVAQVVKDILHNSSVLLSGGPGSGKTSLSLAVAHHLRKRHLHHVSYFSCRKLLADDARASTIKESIEKLLTDAAFGARLGGKSAVILDDLDRICPVETELQVGHENSRTRQISELIRYTVAQRCRSRSKVALIITAQSKDSLHEVLTGGHVIQNSVNLKAPNKEVRCGILKLILEEKISKSTTLQSHRSYEMSHSAFSNIDGSCAPANLSFPPLTFFKADVDILDIASRTDGYMPSDLHLLAARAQGHALTKYIKQNQSQSDVTIATDDFAEVIKGFTPAALRNVALQRSPTTFNAIGGLKTPKRILVETLKYPTTYAPIFDQCPLRLRSGLLLYGYPGCGKTLLASAVAGECGLNFISVKGPEILNKYIGASEKSIRDLFERAEAARPCVLFFDEFDSIAPKRGHDSTGVTDRVVNQLLTQMDGAEGLSGVYVLAATSRPDLIDPALLRPGRLDKSILCDMPSVEDRWDILCTAGKKLNIAPSVLAKDDSGTLSEVARRTNGFTGADLQAILYNAHLQAVHDFLDAKLSRPLAHGTRLASENSRALTIERKDIRHFPLRRPENHSFNKDGERGDIPHISIKGKVAALEARMAGSKVARQKNKEYRRRGPEVGGDDEQGPWRRHEEIWISWQHVESSLKSTKSSMSIEERLKLDQVYREFETARSGEMPSGQAPREIGARSSLM